MGLTISYQIRLANRSAIPPFLAAARAEGKKRGWKIKRAAAGAAKASIQMLPHEDCELVRFDFADGLVCDEIVKTSFAPMKVHVEIVQVLRALQPLAKKILVDDECEYWETGDKKVLKKHRDDFDRAFGKRDTKGGDAGGITITLGSMIVRTAPNDDAIVTTSRGKKVPRAR